LIYEKCGEAHVVKVSGEWLGRLLEFLSNEDVVNTNIAVENLSFPPEDTRD